MIKFDWVTSDEHYSHARVILFCNRPFAPEYEMLRGNISVESSMRMNEALIENHNKLVNPADTVLHIGDFSMGLPALKILSRLNGEHHLIAGNHHKCHPI